MCVKLSLASLFEVVLLLLDVSLPVCRSSASSASGFRLKVFGQSLEVHEMYSLTVLLYAASWSRSWSSLLLGLGSNVYVHKPEDMMDSLLLRQGPVSSATSGGENRHCRNSAKCVGLFSLPPHHDIQLSQFACKYAFPETGLRFELLCKVGVGVVAVRIRPTTFCSAVVVATLAPRSARASSTQVHSWSSAWRERIRQLC